MCQFKFLCRPEFIKSFLKELTDGAVTIYSARLLHTFVILLRLSLHLRKDIILIFHFSKSFSSSVIFSSLLLYTPMYPIIGLFLGESASLSSFFSVFRFHDVLVLMHWTKLTGSVSFWVQSLYRIVSYTVKSTWFRWMQAIASMYNEKLLYKNLLL